MTDSILLKQLIDEKGLKYGFIANKMGLSRAAFYNKINNKTAFDQYEIAKMCDILCLTSKQRNKIFFG